MVAYGKKFMKPGVHILFIALLMTIEGCSGREDTQSPDQFLEFPSDIIAGVDTTAVDLEGNIIRRQVRLGTGGESVFLFNSQGATLLQMDRNFTPIRRLGRFGQGTGELSEHVRQLIGTDKYIIVIDIGNSKAVFYEHDGAFVTELNMDWLSQMRLSFVWDDLKSRLYYLDPASVTDEAMSVVARAPFHKLLGRSYRRLSLAISDPTSIDIQFTVLAGVRNDRLFLVDNYIAVLPPRQVSLQIYSLRDGALFRSTSLLDSQLTAHFETQYRDMYQTANEKSSRPIDLILHPLTHIWIVNDNLVICFVMIRQVNGPASVELLGVDLRTGTVRIIESALLEGKQIVAIAGSTDSTFVVCYRQSDKLRLLSVKLMFTP